MTVINKIEKKYNITYKFGSSSHILYESSGGSEDWAHLKAKIPYTYVIELRPEDDYEDSGVGFLYPEHLIDKAADEIFYGLKEYALLINKNSYSEEIKTKCNEILNKMKSS